MCPLPVASNSLPLKKVVRAISFLCALGSTAQMFSAALTLSLVPRVSQISARSPWVDYSHGLLPLSQRCSAILCVTSAV